jgi:hypothetical protein
MNASRSKKLLPLAAERVIADMQGDVDGYCGVADAFLEHARQMIRQLRAPGWSAEELLSLMHEGANACGAIGGDASTATIRGLENRIRQREAVDLRHAAALTVEELSMTVAQLEQWLAARGRRSAQ